MGVGRLENIIARNRPGRRPQERVVVTMVVGAVILLILVLAVFTDLGRPPADPSPKLQREQGVHGVELRRAR